MRTGATGSTGRKISLRRVGVLSHHESMAAREPFALESDPFWKAVMGAPIEDGEPSEAELLAVEEAKRDGGWVDGTTVSADVAARG